MKTLFPLLIAIVILFSCEKNSILKRNLDERIYRTWYITNYKIDKKERIKDISLSKNQVNFYKFSPSHHASYYSTGGPIDSLQSVSEISLALGSNFIEFPLDHCIKRINEVDPYYYYHNNTLKSKWKIKKMNSGILILTNKKEEHDVLIEITLESNKRNGDWF